MPPYECNESLSSISKDYFFDLHRSSKFQIRMSRDSYTHLKRHLQEKHLTLLINIIQEHLYIEGNYFGLAFTFQSLIICYLNLIIEWLLMSIIW